MEEEQAGKGKKRMEKEEKMKRRGGREKLGKMNQGKVEKRI